MYYSCSECGTYYTKDHKKAKPQPKGYVLVFAMLWTCPECLSKQWKCIHCSRDIPYDSKYAYHRRGCHWCSKSCYEQDLPNSKEWNCRE
jgi:hypothetical protein